MRVMALKRRNAPSIELVGHFLLGRRRARATILMDSGCTGIVINRDYIRKNGLPFKLNPQPFLMVGFKEEQSVSRFYSDLELEFKDKAGHTHRETNRFYIGDIGDQDAIIGTDWLIEHNPDVDWRDYTVSMTRCPETCHLQGAPTLRAQRVIPTGATQSVPVETLLRQLDIKKPEATARHTVTIIEEEA